MRRSEPDDVAARLPPEAIHDYALLADGERGALVGPRGDIVWLCVPRWDSEAVFSSLIGGGGHFSVTPAGRFVHGGYYEQGTLVWRSRWITDTGILECREALAYPADPSRTVLLRRILAVEGDAIVDVIFEPSARFGSDTVKGLKREKGRWTGTTGPVAFRFDGGSSARTRGASSQKRGGLSFRLEVPAGGVHDLVLELVHGTGLSDDPVDAEIAWSSTEAAWSEAIPSFDSTLAPGETRADSYAVLRGLTSDKGGMVAAATTSLPERAEEGRNYDYRYVWIRDQAFTGQAVAADGPHALLDDAVRFVAQRILEDGPKLAPAYTVEGRRVPDQKRLALPGYPGGFDLVGNWVNKQFQLDAFGEALLLFAAASAHDHLDAEGWRAAEIAADAIEARWNEPDAGIWEIADEAWTHSRLTCVAGLRAVARARGAGGKASAATWSGLADVIVADTAASSLHPSGRWQRSPKDPALDAALLLPGLRAALGADDPRTITTLDAYLDDLTEEGFAYRFRHDDRPLAKAEGAFLLCGFVVALALHQQGRSLDAARWFERHCSTRGTGGLFAEEYDIAERQLRGNLPQAFVHALMIECSARLARPWEQSQ